MDLIYGVPDQTVESFESDLERAVALGINHISLYNLTFEKMTPIGRAFHRGKIKEDDIEDEFEFYKSAMRILDKHGFDHEEVSNWSKPGYSCRHNWVYWTMDPYIAFGSGAHGFLKTKDDKVGARYSFGKNDRMLQNIDATNLADGHDHLELIGSLGGAVEPRDSEDAVMEYITTSLRTNAGVPVDDICRIYGKTFEPTKKLSQAIVDGYASKESHLIFKPECWFFENQWAIEVLESFK